MKFFIFCFVLLGFLELSTIHRIELLKNRLLFLSQIKILNISSLNAILDVGVLNSYQTKKKTLCFSYEFLHKLIKYVIFILTWLLFFFGWKGNLALFTRLATWEGGRLIYKNQLPQHDYLTFLLFLLMWSIIFINFKLLFYKSNSKKNERNNQDYS